MQLDFLNNCVLEDGTQVSRVEVLTFATPAEAEAAYNLALDKGIADDPGPIIFADGQQVHLLPHERWWFEKMMRLDMMLMIILAHHL